MPRLASALLTALLLLAAAACDRAETPQPPPLPQAPAAPLTDAQARSLYDRSCMSCHGPTGKGNGPRAAMLRTSPTDLSDPTWQAQADDATLRTTVTEGRGSMPAFKYRLSPEEIDAVLRVVRGLKAAPAP